MRNRAETFYQELKNVPILDIYYLFLIHASFSNLLGFLSNLLGIHGGWSLQTSSNVLFCSTRLILVSGVGESIDRRSSGKRLRSGQLFPSFFPARILVCYVSPLKLQLLLSNHLLQQLSFLWLPVIVSSLEASKR